MQSYWPVFELYQAMRVQMMAVLNDADLAYSPGGANRPLGELCREIGETEQAYLESFRTYKCKFDYRHPEPDIANSVAKLSAWFVELDRQLKDVIAGLSEEQVQTQRVYRGEGFTPPVQIHLAVYQEALLIFYGKASVYLKGLNKPVPEQIRNWIA